MPFSLFPMTESGGGLSAQELTEDYLMHLLVLDWLDDSAVLLHSLTKNSSLGTESSTVWILARRTALRTFRSFSKTKMLDEHHPCICLRIRQDNGRTQLAFASHTSPVDSKPETAFAFCSGHGNVQLLPRFLCFERLGCSHNFYCPVNSFRTN